MKTTEYLGKKVKERRLFLHLTQKDLAGDCVTRNMLSRIENDEALPSLDTAVYLAERLGVSVDYLLSDGENASSGATDALFPRIQSSYRKHAYEDCVTLYETYAPALTPELAFLMTAAYVEVARSEVYSGLLQAALLTLQKAKTCLTETYYPTDGFAAEISVLSAVAENPQAPHLELTPDYILTRCDNASGIELFFYIREEIDYPFMNENYKLHLKARSYMKKSDYFKAIPILLELEDKRSTDKISAFMIFRLFSDLETCYRETRNYEKAYFYSARRLALLTAFRS